MNLRNWTVATLGAAALLLLGISPSFARDFGMGTVTCSDMTIAYSPTTIWPPNHKWRTISIQATDADNETNPTESYSIQVADIISNQNEAKGEGCGRINDDFTSIGNGAAGNDPTPIQTTVRVRGERCGRLGDRVYDIKVTCTDAAAPNGDTVDLFVTVPHSRAH